MPWKRAKAVRSVRLGSVGGVTGQSAVAGRDTTGRTPAAGGSRPYCRSSVTRQAAPPYRQTRPAAGSGRQRRTARNPPRQVRPAIMPARDPGHLRELAVSVRNAERDLGGRETRSGTPQTLALIAPIPVMRPCGAANTASGRQHAASRSSRRASLAVFHAAANAAIISPALIPDSIPTTTPAGPAAAPATSSRHFTPEISQAGRESRLAAASTAASRQQSQHASAGTCTAPRSPTKPRGPSRANTPTAPSRRPARQNWRPPPSVTACAAVPFGDVAAARWSTQADGFWLRWSYRRVMEKCTEPFDALVILTR